MLTNEQVSGLAPTAVRGRTETVGTWLRSVSFGVERRHFLPADRLTRNAVRISVQPGQPTLPEIEHCLITGGHLAAVGL